MRLLSTRILLSLALASSVLFARAATIVAVKNGSWITPETWSCSCQPKRTDTIIVPQGIKVSITRPLILGPSDDGRPLVITVAGELDLTNGSVQLDAVDRIIVLPGGKVSTQNLGGMIFSGIYALYLEGGTHVKGPATLGDGFSPLALLFFNAEKDADGITLNWASGGEININSYNILRSTDGVTYETMGAVSGRGYSRRQKNYSFTDETYPTGTVYYRIDVTDGSGLRTTLATLDLRVENTNGSISVFTDDQPQKP